MKFWKKISTLFYRLILIKDKILCKGIKYKRNLILFILNIGGTNFYRNFHYNYSQLVVNSYKDCIL